MALSACGEATNPQMVTVTETVTQPAAAASPTSNDSGVTETSDTTPTTEGTAGESAEETDDENASDYDFGEPQTNARGNLVKDVGQWAGMTLPNGDFTAVFRVTDIEVDVGCTSQYAQPAKNGQFVALTFEVHTMPELSEDPFGQVMISAHDFAVFDEDSKRENDSVGNAYGCLNESEVLPESIGPGEEVRGKIVLDTGVESGSMVLNGMNMGVDGAWAWDF
ncbi:hypothetical protein [Serinicoccus hydrothermalis]|uniref:hypothetical protein n=1 Tax=Serinicoccus hydrothermalis TaxID=1758689 RepID=UPI00168B059D|nr:hypothetical protein [Serinicoccus hydrothermalis]